MTAFTQLSRLEKNAEIEKALPFCSMLHERQQPEDCRLMPVERPAEDPLLLPLPLAGAHVASRHRY